MSNGAVMVMGQGSRDTTLGVVPVAVTKQTGGLGASASLAFDGDIWLHTLDLLCSAGIASSDESSSLFLLGEVSVRALHDETNPSGHCCLDVG